MAKRNIARDLGDLITQTEAGRLRGMTRQAIHSLISRGRLNSTRSRRENIRLAQRSPGRRDKPKSQD
jgi:hypothetical protein